MPHLQSKVQLYTVSSTRHTGNSATVAGSGTGLGNKPKTSYPIAAAALAQIDCDAPQRLPRPHQVTARSQPPHLRPVVRQQLSLAAAGRLQNLAAALARRALHLRDLDR